MLCYLAIHSYVLLVYILRLRNDLYGVEWGVKLYSLTHAGLYGPSSLQTHKE